MIDAHVHFYDPRREEGLVWPSSDSGMMESALPIGLESAAVGFKLDGVVAIESSRRFVDDQWLLDLAGAENLVQAVVLNLQPDLPDFEARFELARRSQVFRGIRLRPIVDYNLRDAALRDSISMLANAEYSVEFGARTTAQKTALAEMAERFPTCTWILDHCGHPYLGENNLSGEWLESMNQIAGHPNVFVKVTIPNNLAAHASAPALKDACNTLVGTLSNLFGIDRLMFGSNWPVSTIAISYDDIVQVLDHCLANDADREAFFESNCRRAYRLQHRVSVVE